MKLTQMRYFSAVCHYGSITQAADSLFISQPAVTAAIKALEEELGLPLLYRSRKTVLPTPEGKRFLQRCNAILASVDNLVDDFKDLRNARHAITVGVPPMIGYFLFPQIFLQFRNLYPDIHINVHETGSETAKAQIKNGELELAVITMGDTAPAALEAEILGRTELMYCVPPRHRLAGCAPVTLQDIGTDPLILFTSGYYHQQLLNRRFSQAQMQPNILFHSNQVLTIKAFIRHQIANAFLLPQVIEPEDHIVMLPLADPLRLNIAVIWQKDAYLTQEARNFIHFISTQFSKTEK